MSYTSNHEVGRAWRFLVARREDRDVLVMAGWRGHLRRGHGKSPAYRRTLPELGTVLRSRPASSSCAPSLRRPEVRASRPPVARDEVSKCRRYDRQGTTPVGRSSWQSKSACDSHRRTSRGDQATLGPSGPWATDAPRWLDADAAVSAVRCVATADIADCSRLVLAEIATELY